MIKWIKKLFKNKDKNNENIHITKKNNYEFLYERMLAIPTVQLEWFKGERKGC